jgi:hypothetical protein
MQGRMLFTPVNSIMEQGDHEVTLSGQQIPPGIYFCRLITAEGNSSVIKILII